MGIFIGLAVVGLIIGFIIAIPMLIMAVGGVVWAQKYARKVIESGKIENRKRVEAVLKMLRVSSDSESKFLHDKLLAIFEKD